MNSYLILLGFLAINGGDFPFGGRSTIWHHTFSIHSRFIFLLSIGFEKFYSICVVQDIRDESILYFSNTKLRIKIIRLSEVLIDGKMYGWQVESHIILRIFFL